MITRIVKLELKPEHLEAFDTLFEHNKEHILSQKGCLALQLLKDINRPNLRFTSSRWEQESDLNAYRSSDLFASIWPNVKPWFAAKAEAWSLH
ncbi:MAG: putative quinol monooxygenase [Flavobacteriales bacterium]